MSRLSRTTRSLAVVALIGAMASGDVAAQAPGRPVGLPPLPPAYAADPEVRPAQARPGTLPEAIPANPPDGGPTRNNASAGPPGSSPGGTDVSPGAGNTPNAATTPGTGGANTSSASVNAPTSAEAAASGGSKTNYLARFLGIQDAPVKVYGWIQNSYTGNANGRPRNDSNFSVFPNRLADQWQGNQYYLALEKPLSQTDVVNFGGRFDTLFGNDWIFSKSYGLFDRAFKNGQFSGIDLPQIYAEVHLPLFTKNGFDIRGGRFYSPAGFENVQAIKRPLLSVPYLFNFTPFTLVGVFTTLHVNDRINFYNGAVNGWDRWIDQNYRYSYIGGFNYNSRDLQTSLTSIVITGPDQLPRFPPVNSPFLPTGVITTPALQGKPNPYYAGNWRTYLSTVATHNYNARLTEAAEVFFVHETNVPGLGRNGTVNRESAWYGGCHWFLYQFTDKVQGVLRAEVFRDQNGAATSSADTYYEVTLGSVYKPKPWLWARPEIRYDRAQDRHPFSDGRRNDQLTLAFDIIVQF